MADELPGQLAFDLGLEADEAEAHADREQRQFELAQIREANAARVKALMELGRRPDPGGVLMARVNLLLDLLLDPDARTEFEMAFEATMTDMLDQAIGQARQMSLLVPATPPVPAPRQPSTGGGLIIPG